MLIVSLRLSFLAPILVPPRSSVFEPNPNQATKTRSCLPITVAPCERISPPVARVTRFEQSDDLFHKEQKDHNRKCSEPEVTVRISNLKRED